MSCINPRYMSTVRSLLGNPVQIRCGLCGNCKADSVSVWSDRVKFEYNLSSSAFVTLTYDDYHSFYNRGFYKKSLNKLDLHKFIDNLRHHVKNHPYYSTLNRKSFKWFACGEYGDKGRPHFHILILGLTPSTCETLIPKIWRKGRIDVEPMFLSSIRYVMKYLQKQQSKDYNLKNYYDKGLNPPFIAMSTGIGSDYYYAQAKNIAKYGALKFGEKYIPVSSYWKNKVFAYDSKTLNSYIETLKRNFSINENEAHRLGFDNYHDYLTYKSRIKEKVLVKQLRESGVSVQEYSKFGHPYYSVKKVQFCKRHIKNLSLEALNA